MLFAVSGLLRSLWGRRSSRLAKRSIRNHPRPFDVVRSIAASKASGLPSGASRRCSSLEFSTAPGSPAHLRTVILPVNREGLIDREDRRRSWVVTLVRGSAAIRRPSQETPTCTCGLDMRSPMQRPNVTVLW